MLSTLVRRSLVHDRRITLWTLATLTTCAALVVTFTTIALEVGKSMRHTLRTLGANAVAYVGEGPGGADRWEALADALGPSGANMLVLSLRPGMVRGEPVAVVSAEGTGLARMTPYWKINGRRPAGAGECLVGRRAAEHFHVEPGAGLPVEFAGGGRDTLHVTGTFESGDEDEDRIFTTASHSSFGGAATGATGSSGAAPAAPGKVSGGAVPYALLSVPGGESDIDRIATDPGVRAAATVVRPLRQIVHGEENVLAKITLLCALALVVVVILASLAVTASVWARVVERRQEFALIQTLGATRRRVVELLLAEGAVLGGLAAVSGFALGLFVARYMVEDLFGVSAGPRLAAFGAGLAASMVVSMAAGVIGIWRTQRVLPATALRNE